MSNFMKDDHGKPMMSIITPEFRVGLAKVLTFGAVKYTRNNWRSGTNYTRLLDSLHRHLAAFELGEDIDAESGLQHLYHAAANIMFLATFVENPDKYKKFDDRVVGGINEQ